MWNERRRTVTGIQLSRLVLTVTHWEMNFAVLNTDVASHTLTQNQLSLCFPNTGICEIPKILLFLPSKSHSHTRVTLTYICVTWLSSQKALPGPVHFYGSNLSHKSYIPTVAQSTGLMQSSKQVSPSCPSKSLKQWWECHLPGLTALQTS